MFSRIFVLRTFFVATFLPSALLSASAKAAVSSQPPLSGIRLSLGSDGQTTFSVGTLKGRLAVTVKEGQATVMGYLTTCERRRQMLEQIGDIPGLREIVDRVVIKPVARPDPAIRHDVLAAFQSDPSTESASLQVVVAHAVVSLSGSCDSWLDRDLAGWIAGKVSGVQSVNNEIAVVLLPMPDEAIQRSVREQLEAQGIEENVGASFSQKIEVSVSSGVAILSGMVPTLKRKEDVLEIAEAATGVKKVLDQLVVQPVKKISDAEVAQHLHEKISDLLG